MFSPEKSAGQTGVSPRGDFFDSSNNFAFMMKIEVFRYSERPLALVSYAHGKARLEIMNFFT